VTVPLLELRGPLLELRGLEKAFDGATGRVKVLEGLTLSLEEGEILALLGLSGSGKTTALRLLAGFETPDRGEILLEGKDVTRLQPAARGFGMVFQHYALFPHMTIAENVAFGLEARGAAKEVVRERVEAMLQLVDLAALGSRRVSEISGGQQQRVALARALAPSPRLLLLDEPLSNLDPSLRERTREELRAAVKKVGITTVLVTHEQEEAFHVGDRVAVLHRGRLEQLGRPLELYQRPASRFVASFVGRSSRLPGRLLSKFGDLAKVRIEAGGHALELGGRLAETLEDGAAAEVFLRPETLELQQEGGLPGKVTGMRFTGPATYAIVELDGLGRAEVLVGADEDLEGREARVGWRQQGPQAAIFRAGTSDA
jgi:putative spermidine/putrescine transport system ATP-binding protein